MNEIPAGDLEKLDQKVEHTKTFTFGQLLFVSDPKFLASSVVTVSKDGTNNCELMKNVLAERDRYMKVVQCGQSLLQFIPKKLKNRVKVIRIDNISNPDEIEAQELPHLNGYLRYFALA